MSDKRRRRRRASGGTSDEEEEISETGSDHEYESAAEDSALEESEGVEEKIEDIKAEEKEAVSDDPEEVLNEERGAGDGQEEKGGKVDDDEDKRNPQYIPKKGMFYEHDDRIDSNDEEKPEEPQEKPKRVPRSENVERWGHDKFQEREQLPKTREELVSAYGYDIRNEDNAPRARRRRRYGRGPNKYTRNWEDEEAYEPATKPAGKAEKVGEAEEEKPPQRPPRNQGPGLRPNQERKPDSSSHSRGRGGNRGGLTRSTRPPKETRAPQKAKTTTVDSLEKDLSKTKLEEKKKNVGNGSDGHKKIQDFDKAAAAGSPSANTTTNTHTKRYSNSRQQQPQQPRGSLKRNDYYNNSFDNNADASTMYMNGSSSQFSTFPAAANGPPPTAPFMTNPAGVVTPTSTAGFLDPMVNYGPPVQFAPVAAVPVTVTLPLVSVPGAVSSHDSVLATPLGTPTVTSEQVLLAAAAAGQGYAQVHGGVTYFSPTAQAPIMARPVVNKRPKAAIPIVDPSKVVEDSEHQPDSNNAITS